MTDKKRKELKKAFLVAFENAVGNVSYACKKIGISRKTFYVWRNDDEEFASACKEVEESLLDLSETMLLKSIKEGNMIATIFHLKTKGKQRGYVERQELTGEGGSGVKLNIQVDNEDQKDILDNL